MSGKHRRAARAKENARREGRLFDELTDLVTGLTVDFIDAKLAKLPAPPLELFDYNPRPFVVVSSCLLCASAPVVCSVFSRGAFCSVHWQRLWIGSP